MVHEVAFVEPCAWQDKKPRKPAADAAPAPSKHRLASQVSRMGGSLQDIKRQVVEFGSTGLTRKEKKEAEERRLVGLGCTPAKKPKVPLPILRGQHFKQKKRATAQREYEREHELVTANTLKNKTGGKGKRR